MWFSFIKSFLLNKQQLCISTLIFPIKGRTKIRVEEKKMHRKYRGKFLIRAIHAIWLTTSRYRCFPTYFPVFHKYPPPRSINRAKYNIQRTNSEPCRINKWNKMHGGNRLRSGRNCKILLASESNKRRFPLFLFSSIFGHSVQFFFFLGTIFSKFKLPIERRRAG